jgi:CheY-like chemotaxis protein
MDRKSLDRQVKDLKSLNESIPLEEGHVSWDDSERYRWLTKIGFVYPDMGFTSRLLQRKVQEGAVLEGKAGRYVLYANSRKLIRLVEGQDMVHLLTKLAHLMVKKIRSVLLIDDDDISNFLHQKVIEKTAVVENFFMAANGAEGLRILRSLPKEEYPDIILLDIQMPVMDGFDFMEHYLKDEALSKSGARVVVLSTSSNHQDMNRMKNYGIDTYLEKPLKAEHLTELLGALV